MHVQIAEQGLLTIGLQRSAVPRQGRLIGDRGALAILASGQSKRHQKQIQNREFHANTSAVRDRVQ